MEDKNGSLLQQPAIKHGWLRTLLFFFAFLILQIAANIGVGLAIKKLTSANKFPLLQQYPILVLAITNFSVAVLIVYIFRTFIDRRSVSSLGLRWKGFTNHAFTGLFVALFVLLASTLLLLIFGHLVFLGVDFFLPSFLINLLIMALIAIAEELVVRGYMLNNLMQSMPKWAALSITAGVFACLHLLNPSVTVISVISIFIAGFLLGINYIYTRNLWFGIFLHFTWNFVLGPVLGFAVSGLDLDSVLVQSVKGSNWLTGGPFGLEGSLIACLLNAAAAAALGYYYFKKVENSAALGEG